MKTAILAVLAVFLCACAPEVVRSPVTLLEVAPSPRQYVLDKRVELMLDSWHKRAVEAGVTFAEAGGIPQGQVLRPTNTVFSVEGAHVHEAYIVVRGGNLVGFYLPVERAFSPLSNPIPLQLSERKTQ